MKQQTQRASMTLSFKESTLTCKDRSFNIRQTNNDHHRQDQTLPPNKSTDTRALGAPQARLCRENQMAAGDVVQVQATGSNMTLREEINTSR